MKYYTKSREIMANINTIMVGKKDIVELIVITLLAEGHLLIEDVPGVGKTTLANALAKSIDCGFSRIQFTPDTLPSDVSGMSIYNMKTGNFEFSKGAVMSNIVLADEINRTSPKTQASLLEAMEESQVTVDGTTYPLEKPFMVIATQNPIDFLGTYNLPEAQLDRFLMKISIGYPSISDEKLMGEIFLKGDFKATIKAVASKEEVREMQKEVASVLVHKDIVSYIVNIVNATRNSEAISLGASPRASLALIRASQAVAFVNGRDFVTPDDVQKIAYNVLAHRVAISMEAKINKTSTKDIFKKIIGRILVPIIKV